LQSLNDKNCIQLKINEIEKVIAEKLQLYARNCNNMQFLIRINLFYDLYTPKQF